MLNQSQAQICPTCAASLSDWSYSWPQATAAQPAAQPASPAASERERLGCSDLKQGLGAFSRIYSPREEAEVKFRSSLQEF